MVHNKIHNVKVCFSFKKKCSDYGIVIAGIFKQNLLNLQKWKFLVFRESNWETSGEEGAGGGGGVNFLQLTQYH